MEASRLIFAIIFIILILSPDNTTNVPSREYSLKAIIAEEKRWLGVLQNSTYGHVGNLTGFVETGWWSPTGMGIVRDVVHKMIDTVYERTTADDSYLDEHVGTVLDDTAVKRRNIVDGELDPAHVYDIAHTASVTAPSPLSTGLEVYEMNKPEGGHLKELGSTQSGSSLSEAPIYKNITGMLSGDWTRMHLPTLHQSAINGTYQRNITGQKGGFWMVVKERQPKKHWEKVKGNVQTITMNMELYNDWGVHEFEVRMHGIHFVDSGLLIGVSNSDKFAGLFGLPHLTPSNNTYELVKQPLNASLSDQITEHLESGEEYPPWIAADDQYLGAPPLRCEYIVYLQVHPTKIHPTITLNDHSQQSIIDTIERELRHKTGEYVPIYPPPLIGSAIVYSPDCSFVLSASSTTGLKLESYFDRISNFALNACLIIATEIFLMIRQMKESSTPSTLSRVSFWTIGIISLLAGYIVMIFIITASVVERSSLPLISAAFLCTVLSAFFGIRYMLMIYRVQMPEQRAAEAAAAANQPTPAAAAAQAAAARATTTPAGSLPLPATAPTPSTTPAPTPATTATTTTAATNTTNLNNPANIRQDFSSVISRFYMFLVVTGFLMVYSISLPLIIRNTIQRIILFLSLSFWIPQIYRNTYRNCRKSLNWEFVIGISICRLLPVLYFYGYSENILFAKPVKWVCWASIGWMWVQVWVLGVQELLGPRFLVPDGWFPAAYDYYPVLPVDDLERALPGGGSSSNAGVAGGGDGDGRRKGGSRVFDCAICMQSVEVPVMAGGGSNSGSSAAGDRELEEGDRRGGGATSGSGVVNVGGLLGQSVYVGRRSYMVTPCRHVFHSGCLEGWMRVRLQCPICRNNLPPI